MFKMWSKAKELKEDVVEIVNDTFDIPVITTNEKQKSVENTDDLNLEQLC